MSRHSAAWEGGARGRADLAGARAARSLRFLMLNWRDPENPLAGGAERVSVAFMRGLVERGHQVDWFTYAFPGGAEEVVHDGIRYRREGGVKDAAWRARRWAACQPRYDLVIDQHHGLPWFAPWWCGTRCLAYIHEVLGPIWGTFYRWPISTLGRFQERWTHRLYGRVPFWVPSESTRRALTRHGVRQVSVLPNGVDVEPLPVLPDKPLGNELRLISVSRLAPNKRVDHAIRCVRVLRDRGRNVRLTIIGDGMVAGALRELVSRLGVDAEVNFAGFQPERAKLEALGRHHLLLHPSVREGWGLNVIEANALGTPAVVYPVDGLVDSTVHRETGCVSDAETPESMAEAVLWCMDGESRYRSLREAAWKRSAEFQWDRVIPRVCGFLEETACGEKMV